MPRPIVILGPTAGGKSELAVRLAQRLVSAQTKPGGEIVSADSMQVYRHLDVGTAKPSHELRRRVPHHLIDVVEPTQRFTVADWLARARQDMAAIQDRGRQPIVVGGTNLYLKALIEGLISGPQPDPDLRQSLTTRSDGQLHRQLAEVDSQSAQRISPNDRKRMIRALEVYRTTGKPISQLQVQWDEQRADGPAQPAAQEAHDLVLLGLRWDKEALNRRINSRVKRMFFPEACEIESESLPEETRRLVGEGWLGTSDSMQANEAIGYKQCLAAMRDEMTWDEAFEKTKIATRRLAKQQRTWLKRFRGVHWFDATATSIDSLTRSCASVLGS